MLITAQAVENVDKIAWYLNPAYEPVVLVLGFLIGLILAWLLWCRLGSRLLRSEQTKAELAKSLADHSNQKRSLVQTFDKRRELAAKSGFRWADLDGVDKQAADELRALGIRDLDHLRSLSSKQHSLLRDHMLKKKISWSKSNFDSLMAVRGADPTTDATSAMHNETRTKNRSSSAGSAKSSNESDRSNLGLKLPTASGLEVDWATVQGIDPAAAQELKRLGIKNVNQLESLGNDDLRELESHFTSKGIDWQAFSSWRSSQLQSKQDSHKTSSERTSSERTSSEQDRGKNLTIPSSGSADESEVDWSTVDGMDPKLAAELKSLGIKNVNQLQGLSSEDRSLLEARLADKGLDWDWNWLGGWKTSVATGVAGVAGLAASAAAAVGIGKTATKTPENQHDKSDINPQPNQPNVSSTSSGKANPATTGPSVDWSNVDGMDPTMAAELQAMGFQNVEQLENLSDEERKKFESRLAEKGISWNWNLLRRWKRSLHRSDTETKSSMNAGLATSITPESKTGVSDVAGSGSESGSVPNRPSSVPSSAPTNRTKRTSETRAPQRFIPQPPFKYFPGRGFGNRADDTQNIAAALGLDANADQQDWAKLGLDPDLAAKFKRLGIRNLDQLESLSTEQRAKLHSHLVDEGLGWDWRWLNAWKQRLPKQKPVAPLKIHTSSTTEQLTPESTTPERSTSQKKTSHDPIRTDDSTKRIAGSDGSDGSVHFGTNPVAGFAAGVAAAAGGRLVGNDLDRDSKAAADSSTNAGASEPLRASATASASLNLPSDGIPTLFDAVPEWRDDLTLLDGIDGPQSVELRKMGIYNFDQLHDLSTEKRALLQAWFRRRGWSLDMDQWRIASEGNTLMPTMDEIRNKAYEIFKYREERGLHGGDRTDWDQSEWELRGNPSFEYGIPFHVDDFAVTLSGVTPEARDELYRMGLYNMGQINALSPESRLMLTRWFAGPRFKVDLTQAFGWLSQLIAIPEHLDFGRVYRNRPAEIDDLSLIHGIEPANESDLNRIGIYRFQQLVDWDQQNIEAIAEAIGCDVDRIKNNWIPQARQRMR